MAKPRKKADRKPIEARSRAKVSVEWSRGKKPVPQAPRTIAGSPAKATRQTFEERQRKAIKAIAAKWAKQPRQRGL
jgi:hypothetical protein